ncbi:MAG: KH domain-containing protein [Candidatus Peregrinibacteria bacterium]|nr:KH domain-containing protein [Candidatus Peregrinibacteria bacterium]
METIIQKALKILLDKFGVEYDCVAVTDESGHYRANIETPDAGRLIGKNGTVLSALQILLKNILHSQSAEKLFVTVDVDNYRKDQDDRILEKVKGEIEMMQEQNLSEIKLRPMKPYIRRLVHLWIDANYPDLGTDSTGEGMARSVRVFCK